ATDFKSVAELAPLWRTMKGREYLKSDTHCYDRAHTWSYDLYKTHNVETKKIILHYTARYMKELKGGWSWHVAPMVTVQGKEYVLDKNFFNRPVPKAEWLAFFIKPGISKLKYERDKLATKIKNAQWKIDRI